MYKWSKIKSKLSEYIECFRTVRLPDALNKLRFNRILIIIAVLFVCIIAAIICKNPGYLMGIIIPIYMFITIIKLSYDYKNGNINTYELTCMGVKIKRSVTELCFQDEYGRTYAYFYPYKKSQFYENIRYRIYILNKNNKNIMAYEEIQ